MKRIILTILAALVSFAAFSQTREDLTGTWLYTEIDDSDGDLCMLKQYMDYNLDGTCSCRGNIYMEMSLDDDGTRFKAGFSFSAKGTWKLEDDIITYKFSPETITVVNDDEINMPGLLKALFFNPAKNEMKKELKKFPPARIISYNGKEMVVKDTVGRDATEDLFVRQ